MRIVPKEELEQEGTYVCPECQKPASNGWVHANCVRGVPGNFVWKTSGLPIDVKGAGP